MCLGGCHVVRRVPCGAGPGFVVHLFDGSVTEEVVARHVVLGQACLG